jgi:hypothetical protein
METLFLLKQWVLPALCSADMDSLGSASPLLHAFTRKDRVRLHNMQVVVHKWKNDLRFNHPTATIFNIYVRNLNLFKIWMGMDGLRYAN